MIVNQLKNSHKTILGLVLYFCLYGHAWAEVSLICVFDPPLSEAGVTPEEAVADILEGKSPEEQIDSAICITQALKHEGLDALEAGVALVSGGYPEGIALGVVIEVYNPSESEIARLESILSARGASMLVRKKIFWDLGGFDEKYFATFEDVDLGWRAWISGYRVILAPNSIVYHTSGQTIHSLGSDIKFHGVKNNLMLRLVNFETSYAFVSIIKLFGVSLARRLFGINLIQDPEPSPPLPSWIILLRGSLWVLKNLNYILSKRKKVNSKRVRSTKELIELNLITKY